MVHRPLRENPIRTPGLGIRIARATPFVLAALSLALPSRSLAATLYVDAAAAAAPPGTGCGAAAAYTRICAAPGPGLGTPCAAGSALAAASSNDTIEVCAGTYNENVEISLSSITLRGAKAGVPAGPAATPAGRGSGESIIVGQTTSAIHLAVAGITGSVIDGFTIQSGNFPAIHDNPNGLSGSHVWVNNIMEANAACTPALINLNRINDVEIRHNNLKRCQWGISVQSGNPADAPSLIEGNYIADNAASAGAVIMAANNAAGHTIRDNLVEGTGSGMILGCGDLEITGNTIQNRGTALFLHTNATGATITGNDLLNDSNGVRQSIVFGPYNLGPLNEVHYNNIVGSTFYGARNEVTPGDQDISATCNWWGSADGPAPAGSGDVVTAGVEYVPWLVAPAPDGACVGGLPTSTPTATSTATATATATHTPTATATATATDTPLPNGSGCGGPEDCQSGNCVDAVCCNEACAAADEVCNLPGNVGTCVRTAPAPAASPTGLAIALGVLGLVALVALWRRRREPADHPPAP